MSQWEGHSIGERSGRLNEVNLIMCSIDVTQTHMNTLFVFCCGENETKSCLICSIGFLLILTVIYEN